MEKSYCNFLWDPLIFLFWVVFLKVYSIRTKTKTAVVQTPTQFTFIAKVALVVGGFDRILYCKFKFEVQDSETLRVATAQAPRSSHVVQTRPSALGQR